jgi:ATP-dependent helicase HrpB
VPLAPLPVDSHLDAIREALETHRAAVVTAAPGAGKTTRVPPALVDFGLSRRSQSAKADRVLLLQPRRVAARAMARRIAEERGWTVGREIGWHIRFDRQFTRDTTLLVVTEGILTAYLQDDPLLSDVSTVILDEFHERSVHADLGLALVKQAWTARPDLHLVVMSATLDTAPVARFLGGCPVIEVPGLLHPLTIDYAPGQSIATALSELLPRSNGNVLCFLPGAAEIAAAIGEANPIARSHGVELRPLHGSLDAREQDAVLRPTEGRRVIVATNVAETSLTVPGVSAVIDSGLHKVSRYDDDRAIDSLVTERITLDSADQRAGRAARLGPGRARRLWDERDRLRPHREAEIHRVDLSSTVLAVLAWGSDPTAFEWFDPPSRERIAAAMALLTRLDAVEHGRITHVGRLLQKLSLPPRLARIYLESFGAIEACRACAWLAEPARLPHGAAATTSDVLTVLDRWTEVPEHVKRSADRLEQIAVKSFGDRRVAHLSEVELRQTLLVGYRDRVAKRRSADKVTLASGHGAKLGRETGVHDAEWLIALDVTAGRSGGNTLSRRSSGGAKAEEAIIRMASRIEREWLQPTRSTEEQRIDNSGAFKSTLVHWYDELVLAERPALVNMNAMTAAVLAAAWKERGGDTQTKQLQARLRFAQLDVDLSAYVLAAAQQARRVQDIVVTEDVLSWEMRKRLASLAPATLTVPSGRTMPIEYEADGSVSVSVKLQELFGLGETPTLGPNKIPVTFHLLAPNGRPVQTTRDLKSFWARTYPEVRKELRGRYPRHPWPDDPWSATPTHRTKKRIS